MRLKALQGLEREKLLAEYEELEKKIAHYHEVLQDINLVKGILKEELIAIRDKFGDERMTEIQNVEDEIDIEDLIEEEDCCYTLSNQGYIKRMAVDMYRAQKRGGRGVNAQNLKENDFVRRLFVASTHDYILFFSNTGRVHRRKGYLIPEAGRTARGTAIVNVLPLEAEEKITAMLLTRDMQTDAYIVMVTRNGTVKRLKLERLNTARKTGIRAITLDEGDELISVLKTSGQDNIILASHHGMAICFNETDIRPMGRDATGVRGIRLEDGDYLIGAEIAEEGKQLLTVTENGYGKRTAVDEYLRNAENGKKQPQQRGGKGVKNYAITAKTGWIAGISVVSDADDIMMIEDGGIMIRMSAADINVYKRDTQGVIVMRVEEGNRVIALQRVDASPEDSFEEA